MTRTKFSKHALEDREDRIIWIATKVGFGEVIDELQIYDDERGRRRVCLTTTGVAIIKAADCEFVLTMFIPTQHQIIGWYGAKEATPIHLLNVAKRNEKKGWTSNGM